MTPNEATTTTSKDKTVYLMTGDIGGTNARMSLYRALDGINGTPLVEHYYRNATTIPENERQANTFRKYIVIPFLQHCWQENSNLAPLHEVDIVATLATAGVVSNNQVSMTNLGNLFVDGTAIEKDTSNKYVERIVVCRIINDFVAQGYGCLTLKDSEVRHLYGPKHSVQALPDGPKVCIGAGTGLGECYLTPTQEQGHNSSYSCFPSEGGHVEYAPRNELEIKMFHYLSQKFASKHRISVERVVSGTGLANCYEFLAHTFPNEINETIHHEFIKAGDQKGRVVATNTKESKLCHQAMTIMMSAYGCEVGSAAIKWIPTGGLFVTGGLTPKNINFIDGKDTCFMQSFVNKGRVSTLLDRIPVFAVLCEDLGVRGAHQAALMEYEKYKHGGMVPRSNRQDKEYSIKYSIALLASAAVGFGLGSLVSRKK